MSLCLINPAFLSSPGLSLLLLADPFQSHLSLNARGYSLTGVTFSCARFPELLHGFPNCFGFLHSEY